MGYSMSDYQPFVSFLLNFSPLWLTLVFLFLMCWKFPKEIKVEDSDWLHNNIWEIIGTSGAMGGYIVLCIGIVFLVVVGRWPSEYLAPNTIGGSMFALSIYLFVHACHEWKNWPLKIRKRYGKVLPEKRE